MYDVALRGEAKVVPQRGQWAVYTHVEFEDEIHVGYFGTFFTEDRAKFAAKVITLAMNRTDLRERGIVDY